MQHYCALCQHSLRQSHAMSLTMAAGHVTIAGIALCSKVNQMTSSNIGPELGAGMKFPLCHALVFCCLSLSPALAADLATPVANEAVPADQPQVPGDDIFGFTSPSDTGNVGEKSVSLESTTRFGKGGGLYVTPSVKIEFGYAIAENAWVALSPFVTNYRIRDVSGIDNLNRTRFDGLSGEFIWRFLPRTTSGLAASFSAEPRWAQLDGVSGLGVNALSVEFKVYIDQVIIPDQLFAALNLNYQPGAQQAN